MITVELSIILINYNTKELTKQAVASIFDCSPALDFEIIIVDNSSDPKQQYDLTRDRVRILSHVGRITALEMRAISALRMHKANICFS